MLANETGPVGWGADLPHENRPGVPRELRPPRAMGAAHWDVPEPQRTSRGSSISTTRTLTPTYSSAVPERGVSGLLRNAAYRIPEYKPRRWMMLMLADRVDVIEHNLPKTALWLGGIGALAALYFALRPGSSAPRVVRERARRLTRRVRGRYEEPGLPEYSRDSARAEYLTDYAVVR